MTGMNEKASDPEGRIVIREMNPSDAKDAAELSSELGYPASADEMEERLRQFAALGNHVVYAACLEDRVVGWIGVGIVHHLQSQAFGEIDGLIVGSKHQGRGIGRKLVKKAEEWIARRGVARVLVRSRITREGAHAFYLRQNFSRVKTSAVFEKSIDAL